MVHEITHERELHIADCSDSYYRWLTTVMVIKLETQKIIDGHVNNTEKNQKIVDKVMPVLKGFMTAISD